MVCVRVCVCVCVCVCVVCCVVYVGVVENTYGWIIIRNEDILDKLDNQRAL